MRTCPIPLRLQNFRTFWEKFRLHWVNSDRWGKNNRKLPRRKVSSSDSNLSQKASSCGEGVRHIGQKVELIETKIFIFNLILKNKNVLIWELKKYQPKLVYLSYTFCQCYHFYLCNFKLYFTDKFHYLKPVEQGCHQSSRFIIYLQI